MSGEQPHRDDDTHEGERDQHPSRDRQGGPPHQQPQQGGGQPDQQPGAARPDQQAGTTGSGRAGGTRQSSAGATGGSATDVMEDVSVSRSVIGAAATVLAMYLVMGVALALSGILLLNLYGGSIGGRFGIGVASLGLASVAFVTLAGPALAGPVGLWIQEASDGPVMGAAVSAVANGVGSFFMAFLAAFFLALEFTGLQLVDLLIPFFFAAVFAGVVGVVTAGIGALIK